MAAPDLSKLNLSPEETKNMTRLMKDPKFMEMFADYAQEITDPKNRQEMENALKEAEKRGEKVPGFPEGKELIIPIAAFCAKTKNAETGLKVFINICHSDKIQEATAKERPDKSGTEWLIPYSLASPIKAMDKGGAECDVHDFVVNTETHKLALNEYRFKKFLVETAIDNIEKQRHVKLSREFILPRLKYKGSNGEPPLLTVSKVPAPETAHNTGTGTKGKKKQSSNGNVNSVSTPRPTSKKSTPGSPRAASNKSERENNDVDSQSINKDLTSQCSGKPLSSSGLNHEAESNSLPKLSSTSTNSTVPPDWNENGSGKPAEEVEPKYKIVYRNHLDLAQFWEDKANLNICKDEVKEIILHVHLPGVVELSDIKLDVSQTKVGVVVPSKFKLQVLLTYQIDPERGQAKFDKERLLYQLEVTLPVVKYQPRVEHDKETLMM